MGFFWRPRKLALGWSDCQFDLWSRGRGSFIPGVGLLYLVLGYVAQNDVYRGLMSSDEDNPVGVVLLCL